MRTLKTIRTCAVRVETPCPKRWDALEPTHEDGVRHCSACQSLVYLCVSPEETLEHARRRHCIAREEPDPSELPRMVLGKATVVETEPDRELARQLSRRERAIDRVLRAGVDDETRKCPACGYPVPASRVHCFVCEHPVGRDLA